MVEQLVQAVFVKQHRLLCNGLLLLPRLAFQLALPLVIHELLTIAQPPVWRRCPRLRQCCSYVKAGLAFSVLKTTRTSVV